MNLRLASIDKESAPGQDAIVLLDRVGWQLSNRLIVPMTFVSAAELPGIEPAGKHLAGHARQLVPNRFFNFDSDIFDHYCRALNRLGDRPRYTVPLHGRAYRL